MRIVRIRTTLLYVTLHTYELAALIAAARWVSEGAKGELPAEALNQLRHVLTDYDAEFQRSMKNYHKEKKL